MVADTWTVRRCTWVLPMGNQNPLVESGSQDSSSSRCSYYCLGSNRTGNNSLHLLGGVAMSHLEPAADIALQDHRGPPMSRVDPDCTVCDGKGVNTNPDTGKIRYCQCRYKIPKEQPMTTTNNPEERLCPKCKSFMQKEGNDLYCLTCNYTEKR